MPLERGSENGTWFGKSIIEGRIARGSYGKDTNPRCKRCTHGICISLHCHYCPLLFPIFPTVLPQISQNIAKICQKYFQFFIAIEILSQYFCQILQKYSVEIFQYCKNIYKAVKKVSKIFLSHFKNTIIKISTHIVRNIFNLLLQWKYCGNIFVKYCKIFYCNIKILTFWNIFANK